MGGRIESRKVQLDPRRDAAVVTQMEQRYLFFANEADAARKMGKRGRSCVVSVYFREP
jgi:hypothetical protein